VGERPGGPLGVGGRGVVLALREPCGCDGVAGGGGARCTQGLGRGAGGAEGPLRPRGGGRGRHRRRRGQRAEAAAAAVGEIGTIGGGAVAADRGGGDAPAVPPRKSRRQRRAAAAATAAAAAAEGAEAVAMGVAASGVPLSARAYGSPSGAVVDGEAGTRDAAAGVVAGGLDGEPPPLLGDCAPEELLLGSSDEDVYGVVGEGVDIVDDVV